MALLNRDKVSEKAEKTARELDTANFRITQLENRFRELQFTNEALWELLKISAELPDDALEEKLNAMKQAIEERANQTMTCDSCQRIVPADKPSCYYCGAQLTHES